MGHELESAAKVLQPESQPVGPTLASESKDIAKGGAIVVLGTLFAQVLGMAATLWIARVLGPDQYGLLSLASSVLLPLASLAVLGLPNTLVRFIPVHIGNKEDEELAGVLSSAFVMATVASLLITAGVVVLAPLISNVIFSEPRLTPVLRVLSLSIPLMVAANLATAATRGTRVMHFSAIVQVAGPLFRILAWGAGLLLLTNLLDAAIIATLLQSLFPALLALIFAYWIFRGYFGNGIRWSFRPLWVYSAPLILSTLMYSIAPRVDRLVLGMVSDTRAVGVYSVAVSLIFILTLVHGSVVKTFSPVVADAYNRVSVERAKKLYIAVTRWDARLTYVAVVGALLIAPEILGVLGESYAEAQLPFVILAVAVYVGTIPGPTGALLQMTNRQRVEAANAIIFLVLSPVVQLALAAWLGWIGVAVGVLVMAVVLNVIQVVEIRHFYSFDPFKQDHLLFTILSAGLVLLSALASLQQDLPVRIALLGLIAGSFSAFVYLTRTPDDASLFRMIIEGTPLGKNRQR